MHPPLVRFGAAMAAIAVAAGAFGAHALRARLTSDLLGTFETAARYQMYHALALLWLGAYTKGGSAGKVRVAAWLFGLGTVLFSGSLYALVLTGHRALGAITPLGGVCFIAGWLVVASLAVDRADLT